MEIEDKLSLVDKQHRLFQKDVPFTKYQVAGGQFAIYAGLNGTINKVIFDGDEDHTLPSNLRKLGLKLSQGKRCDTWGTSRKKMMLGRYFKMFVDLMNSILRRAIKRT